MGRLEGLQFLKANVIEEKACDLKRPFAFISYAHDEEDTSIVRNVFQRLYDKGYNLWIDTANIPKNENSWKDAAQDALMNEERTCKLALYFRSEESMIRSPILDELEMIKVLEHIQRIITIDIWHEDGMTAKKYGQRLIKEIKKRELKIYKGICEFVDPDNSAYRGQDVDHDLEVLVNELARELEKDGVHSTIVSPPPIDLCTVSFYLDGRLVDKKKVEKGGKVPCPSETAKDGYVFKGWFGREGGAQPWRFDFDAVEEDLNLYGEWEPCIPPAPPVPSGKKYTYVLFGETRGADMQGEMMYDVFAALTARHPDKAEALTKRTSVARAEDVANPGTVDSNPKYFRSCRKFTVGGHDYYVGISYGFGGKLTEIKGMLRICGESEDAFSLADGKGPDSGPGGGNGPGGEGGPGGGTDPDGHLFVYRLWETTCKAKSLADMMHNAFDTIAARYPEKVEAMADDGALTAVARKGDVDERKLPPAKLGYFDQSREHMSGGKIYYVSNRYNRTQGIGQIEKMMEICEGNSSAFKILSEPPTKGKGKGKSGGKQGLDELMDE